MAKRIAKGNTKSATSLRRLPGEPGFRKKPSSEQIIEAIGEAISSIPRGRVASYGAVAAGAGYPKHIRMVPRVLNLHGDGLPWHRVTGAGGAIKIPNEAAREQRLRLEAEGVRFKNGKVDLERFGFEFGD